MFTSISLVPLPRQQHQPPLTHPNSYCFTKYWSPCLRDFLSVWVERDLDVGPHHEALLDVLYFR